MKRILLTACVAATLSACSWGIRLDSGGSRVRTAWNDDVSACRSLGTVTVSVLDHVGPLDRNSLKVRDELEVLARNEAATLGADTIKPRGEPRDGEQSWDAYRCGPAARAANESREPAEGAAETFPIRER